MAEYIDKENAVNSAVIATYGSGSHVIVSEVIRAIPSADVAPVVHGRWIPYNNEQDKGFHYCSVCKTQAFNYEDGCEVVEVLSKFCHDCGAKMDMEQG